MGQDVLAAEMVDYGIELVPRREPVEKCTRLVWLRHPKFRCHAGGRCWDVGGGCVSQPFPERTGGGTHPETRRRSGRSRTCRGRSEECPPSVANPPQPFRQTSVGAFPAASTECRVSQGQAKSQEAGRNLDRRSPAGSPYTFVQWATTVSSPSSSAVLGQAELGFAAGPVMLSPDDRTSTIVLDLR